jgi:hypothetical protein
MGDFLAFTDRRSIQPIEAVDFARELVARLAHQEIPRFIARVSPLKP